VTKFRLDALLTTSRGKELDMKIDYHKKGKVTFSMEEYVKRFLMKCPITWTALQRAASSNSFSVLGNLYAISSDSRIASMQLYTQE